MLHRARSAVARTRGARPGAGASADRLTQVLVPVGGWLPPAADDPGWHPQDEQTRQDGPLPNGTPEAGEDWPFASQDAERHPDDRALDDEDRQPSWSPAGRHATRVGAPWWRLELGRAAVGGLLVVAVLAALIAAGVVLHGRPQEVAAPVVSGRSPAPGLDAPGRDAPAVEATGVPLPGAEATGEAAARPGHVVVAVAGKVRSPGLVRLPAGSRVDDAVKAAGGPVDPTAVGLLNLARVLVDGEQVLVGVDPPPGAPPPAAAPGSVTGGAAGPLDLNAASATDLDALPGIGPVLAQRIVDWRTENGRFASVDQLREVTGIGEAKYQDLVAKVVV